VVASQITLTLRGGTITFALRQIEALTFEPSGALQIVLRLEGTVTQATRRFHELAGAPVGGGGVTVIAPDGSISTTVKFVVAEVDEN
jgi:hypothetical protein